MFVFSALPTEHQLFLIEDWANCLSLFTLSLPFPRFLSGSVAHILAVSHGSQGGRAGDAPWFGHGAPHPAAPAFTPFTILPTTSQLLLPTTASPANPGKGEKTE